METTAGDLMSALTTFASAEEIGTADQVSADSPTTTVITTTLILGVADSDEA